jgi:sugar/nucleoside kinase (ribokinase family)
MGHGRALHLRTPMTSKIVGTGYVALDIISTFGATGSEGYQCGGSCGNVLSILGYLGWESFAAFRTGRDRAAKLVRDGLLAHRVDLTGVVSDLRETPRILELLNTDTGRHRFQLVCPVCGRYFERYRSLTLPQAKAARELLPTPDVFFYDRSSPAVHYLATEYRSAGALVYSEPQKLSAMPPAALASCDVVKYAQRDAPDDQGVRALVEPAKWPMLEIQTLGVHGARYRLRRMTRWVAKPQTQVRAVDTTGAGDWFTGGLLWSLAKVSPQVKGTLDDRTSVEAAIEDAQRLAAYNCQFVGARGALDVLERAELLADLSRSEHRDTPVMRRSRPRTQHLDCRLCLRPQTRETSDLPA